MTAIRLDGKAAAAQIKVELAERVGALKERGITPGIATVLVGADPASQLYVGMKHRDSEAIGMNSIQRSEEHTSELQSLMRISYAVFCLKKKKKKYNTQQKLQA